MRASRGTVLQVTLILLGLLITVLAAFLSIVQHEVKLITWSVARTQAFYLAEAGLAAANDTLAQGWQQQSDPTIFPMRQRIFAQADDTHRAPVGEFEVWVWPLEADLVQIRSTGRSSAGIGGAHSASAPAASRVLTMVIRRRQKPVFARRGDGSTLELEAIHGDDTSLPQAIIFSGQLLGRGGELQGTLSAGGGVGRPAGLHLYSSLTDLDADGDLDLVVSDLPSRDNGDADFLVPTIKLEPEDLAARPTNETRADTFGTGEPIPVLARGWIWLPDQALSGMEPESDVFYNGVVDDGTLIVSWAERSSLGQ